ncbi:MAG: aminopeptidase P family protein [Promethearchaeota archaeon]|nr:MAG: aminopeptidase P family protein [Candidatus Lokiarchaeota archaeon]
MTKFKPISGEKFTKIIDFLTENNIDFLMINNSEETRSPNMQYLTGHPQDATAFVTQKGETYLLPWDISLANKYAVVDEIFDVQNFDKSYMKFLQYFLSEKIKKNKATVGVPSSYSFGSYLMFKNHAPQLEFFTEPQKVSNLLGDLRTTKSPQELDFLREAANIGNKTIPEIEKFALNATDETENDLSILVRKKMIDMGAIDVAFDALVGNTNRSHNIHCYPLASTEKFALPGLALIDYGANYEGYRSDITVPISFGELNDKQKEIRELTRKAYDAAIAILEVGVPLWKVHEAAVNEIEKAGHNMPHSLGHGIGLATHDAPYVSAKPKDPMSLQYWKEVKAENGMVFTIEPGVYVEGEGGQRLENDVIIWNDKVEVITKSRFITVP